MKYNNTRRVCNSTPFNVFSQREALATMESFGAQLRTLRGVKHNDTTIASFAGTRHIPCGGECFQ